MSHPRGRLTRSFTGYALHTPTLGLTCPCPPIISRRLSAVFFLRLSLRAKIPQAATFNATHTVLLHPCGSTLEGDLGSHIDAHYRGGYRGCRLLVHSPIDPTCR